MNIYQTRRNFFKKILAVSSVFFLSADKGKAMRSLKSFNPADQEGPTSCDYAPPGEYIKDHTIIFNEGWYHLFSISGTRGYYHGYNGNEETFSWSISKNLVDWEFRGHVIHPSLRAGTYDQHEVWAPFCIKTGNKFYMFYTGVVHPHRPMEYKRLGSKQPWVAEGHKETQGLAISEDLTDWVKIDDPVKGIGIRGRDSNVVRDDENDRWLLYSTGSGTTYKDVPMDDVYVSQSKKMVDWEYIGTCARFPKLDVNKSYGYTVESWRGFKNWAGTTESITVMKHPISQQWIMMGNWQFALSPDPVNFITSDVLYYENNFHGKPADMGFANEIVQYRGRWYRSGTIGKTDYWRLGFTEIQWVSDGAFKIVKPSTIVLNGLY